MDTVASRRPDDVDVKPPSPPDTVLSIPDLPLGFHLFVPSPHDVALPTPIELAGPPPPPPPPPPGSYPQQQPPPPEYYQQPPPPGYYQQPPPGYYQQPPPRNAQQQPPPGYYYYGPPPTTPPPPPPPPPPDAGGGQAEGVVNNGEPNSNPKPFKDPAIRNKFIFKVYAILSVQLLITAVIVGIISMTEEGREFIRIHMWLAAVAVVLQFVLFVVLVCCVDVRRKVPLNFILLSIYTVSLAIVASAIAAGTQTIIVALAFGLTAMVTIIVTIIATLPCFDMTKYGGILFLFTIIFFVFSVMASVFWVYLQDSFMSLVISATCVILFTAYLLYDTQRILGGRTVEMSPEDYILGAIFLYFDIIVIFIYILRVLGACAKATEREG